MNNIYNDEQIYHKEGELYRTFLIHGKSFSLYYGYYDDRDREYYNSEPTPIYPDLLNEPQYTDEGYPIVTMMQDPCRFYEGDIETDNNCAMCKHFNKCEEFFGICSCRINRVGHHLLDKIAERLGCSRDDLKKPEYRELVLKELKEGEYDGCTAREIREVASYIASPVKVLLYGTEDDKKLLQEWENGEFLFSDIVVCSDLDSYVKAVKDKSIDIIICMADHEDGVEALKVAYTKAPKKPLMWFPTMTHFFLESYKYGCSYCTTQREMNMTTLLFALKRCKEK